MDENMGSGSSFTEPTACEALAFHQSLMTPAPKMRAWLFQKGRLEFHDCSFSSVPPPKATFLLTQVNRQKFNCRPDLTNDLMFFLIVIFKWCDIISDHVLTSISHTGSNSILNSINPAGQRGRKHTGKVVFYGALLSHTHKCIKQQHKLPFW